MTKASDRLLNIAGVFNTDIKVFRISAGIHNIGVSINRVSSKDSHSSSIASSIFGRGTDFESACQDFLSRAGGKLLFGDDRAYYGDNRPEFICL